MINYLFISLFFYFYYSEIEVVRRSDCFRFVPDIDDVSISSIISSVLGMDAIVDK